MAIGRVEKRWRCSKDEVVGLLYVCMYVGMLVSAFDACTQSVVVRRSTDEG